MNQTKCFKCNKFGYKKKDCRGKPCQEYIDYFKRNYTCNNCKEHGHFAKECPKNDKSDAKAFVSVSLSSAAVYKVRLESESWYMDVRQPII